MQLWEEAEKMHFKRIMTLAAGIMLIGVWLFLVIRINTIYATPKEYPVREGEECKYRGLTITVGDIHFCTYDELIEMWQELKVSDDMSEMVQALMMSEEDARRSYFITIEYDIENRTNEVLSTTNGKESMNMVIEVGASANSSQYSFGKILNKNMTDFFQPGEKYHVRQVYSFYDVLSADLIKKSDIKIVYSLYPTKNYFYYPADERR